MLFIMIFLYPIFYQLKIISVYEYLERRFDIKTRLLLSGLFQLMRVFATAVTVYSISLVVELITGLSFFWSVLILGLVTIVYDVLGGIKATIYSDVLQMTILITVLLMVMFILIDNFGDLSTLLNNFSEDRKASLRFDNHGFGDGEDFAFWPMLIGGFFLYVSYYGCDQSQVQRELCARSQNDGQKILFINGIAISNSLALLHGRSWNWCVCFIQPKLSGKHSDKQWNSKFQFSCTDFFNARVADRLGRAIACSAFCRSNVITRFSDK